jgi:putative aldouronate transport system permease protein
MPLPGRTPFERIESAIIVSTLLLLTIVCVQPILNLLAVSLSDPARVPGMSGLAVVPNGFSTDVYALLITNPAVQRGW